jgi:2-C-methyl-D-erythritol 2,4-cyclodiphosphate synthase
MVTIDIAEMIIPTVVVSGFEPVIIFIAEPAVAQAPKLAPHYLLMRKSVAGLCKVAADRISIKATTTERLGWVGAGKGMAATALVLLAK